MLNVLVVYDVPGWAYYYESLALKRHAPADVRVRLAGFSRSGGGTDEQHAAALDGVLGNEPPDILFLLCHHQASRVRWALVHRGWPTRLVVSWNNGWPRLEAAYRAVFAEADAVIVNNLEYWDRSGRPERSHHISNGVDLGTFQVRRPLAGRRPRVLWCGSEYHRVLKGHDHFIVPMFERLQAEGIECETLLVDSRATDNRTPEEMAEWYNTGTVYVCASETEGTPNTALEAAACGCSLVSTAVGNMPELIRHGENGLIVPRDLESLTAGVRRAISEYPQLASQLQYDIQAWGWNTRTEQFYTLFRRLAAEARQSSVVGAGAGVCDRPDLSAEVTVFVSTVGAPSFADCMAHLERQDCRFRLRVIENVAPMSAAFQRMLDECETPFYVQVDEDMLLHPPAVRVLHDWLRGSKPDIAMVAAWLWDVHLGRGIIGVKIFRHEIARRYPLANVQSCEMDQLQRLKRNGYRYLTPPDERPTEKGQWTLGLHGTHYGPLSIFERYATLERVLCQHPDKLGWFEAHGADFLRRFRADPSEINAMAVLGILAGRLSGDRPVGEKDFTAYDCLLGLREARAFFSACTNAVPLSPADDSRSSEPASPSPQHPPRSPRS